MTADLDALDAEIALLRGWTAADGATVKWWPRTTNATQDADARAWDSILQGSPESSPPPFSREWALAGPLMGEFGDVRLFSPAPDLSTWLCVWHEGRGGSPHDGAERREETGAIGPEAIARAWLAWKRAQIDTLRDLGPGCDCADRAIANPGVEIHCPKCGTDILSPLDP